MMGSAGLGRYRHAQRHPLPKILGPPLYSRLKYTRKLLAPQKQQQQEEEEPVEEILLSTMDAGFDAGGEHPHACTLVFTDKGPLYVVINDQVAHRIPMSSIQSVQENNNTHGPDQRVITITIITNNNNNNAAPSSSSAPSPSPSPSLPPLICLSFHFATKDGHPCSAGSPLLRLASHRHK